MGYYAVPTTNVLRPHLHLALAGSVHLDEALDHLEGAVRPWEALRPPVVQQGVVNTLRWQPWRTSLFWEIIKPMSLTPLSSHDTVPICQVCVRIVGRWWRSLETPGTSDSALTVHSHLEQAVQRPLWKVLKVLIKARQHKVFVPASQATIKLWSEQVKTPQSFCLSKSRHDTFLRKSNRHLAGFHPVNLPLSHFHSDLSLERSWCWTLAYWTWGCAELIFVTNITNYISGEKTVMWRNFSLLCRIWTICGV